MEMAVIALTPVMGFTNQDLLPILMLHLAASLVIYLALITKSLNVRQKIKKATDPVGHAGMTFISSGGITLVCTLASFVMQQLGSEIPEMNVALLAINFAEASCTYFLPVGWTLAGLSATLVYLGFVMPAWLRQSLEKKNQKVYDDITEII
jgi:hypothetical protein